MHCFNGRLIFNLTMMISFILYSAEIPFSRGGISVESIASYVKVQAKLGLVLMWNQEDSLWVCFLPTVFDATNVSKVIYNK